MASEIDELKELARRNMAVTEDTNRMVHKMRRSQWWGRVFQFLWWAGIIVISGAAYYYYLQPYMAQLLTLYQKMQQGGVQAQNAAQQLQQMLSSLTSFFPHGTSTHQ